MTSDEVKQSIRNWCSSDNDLEIGSDRFEPSTEFAFTIRTAVQSSSPVELLVLKGEGADRVTLRRSVTLTGDTVDAARKLIDSRPGSVSAAVERSGLDTTVVAQSFVYLDGLSQHTFVQAAAELSRTGMLLDGLGGAETEDAAAEEATPAEDAVGVAAVVLEEPAVTPAPAATPEPSPVSSIPASTVQQPSFPQPSPSPAGFPVGQPLPQPSFTPQPAQPVQPQPAAQPTFTPQPAQPYQAQPVQAQPVQAQPVPQPAPASQWVPSHSVPPQGLRAWAAPDPSGPVVANLAPGLPIQVAEVRGAWARVICSNGWTGWIDGRIIGVAA
jgi:Bacterial SH3 domain